MNTTRRSFLLSPALLALAGKAQADLPPVRAITRAPGHHWFGYYDKLQFDPTSRYVLGMRVELEHRSPRADDVIQLGVIDLRDGDRWQDLGKSRAWNWQQGCMLQWVPGWNRRHLERPAGRALRLRDPKLQNGQGARDRRPGLHAEPQWPRGSLPDFRRLNDCRPGYGYAGLPDPNFDKRIPDDAGIWRVDLRTGRSSLLIPFSQAAAIPYPPGYSNGAKHWFNHLLYNTMARASSSCTAGAATLKRAPASPLACSRPIARAMICSCWTHTVKPRIWRNAKHVLAWAWHPSRGDKFYLYADKTERVSASVPM